MKNNVLAICLLVLFSTSCKKQTFQIDDIMLPCYDSLYQKENHDIKAIIEDYEKALVKEGVLKEASGKSYLEVMRKINSDKDFRITSPTFQEFDPFYKVAGETKQAVFECEKEMIEVAKQMDPKWRRLSNFESPEIKENPDLMYQAMAEGLSEDDLNSYYFRLKMFQLFDMVNSKNWKTTP